jgi:hypothetical protein
MKHIVGKRSRRQQQQQQRGAAHLVRNCRKARLLPL